MTKYLIQLGLKNADAAYRFYSVEKDQAAAEQWWLRRCYWEQRLQAIEAKEKADCRGLIIQGDFL
jgi:hypothetical protein